MLIKTKDNKNSFECTRITSHSIKKSFIHGYILKINYETPSYCFKFKSIKFEYSSIIDAIENINFIFEQLENK